MAKRKPPTVARLRKKLWTEMSIYYRSTSAADGSEIYGYCFTCDKRISLKYEADLGHGYKKGCCEFHRYNPDNLRIQCGSCNIGRDGEQVEFLKRLRIELGDEIVDEMHKRRNDLIKRGIQWYRDELAKYKEWNKNLPFKLSDNVE